MDRDTIRNAILERFGEFSPQPFPFPKPPQPPTPDNYNITYGDNGEIYLGGNLIGTIPNVDMNEIIGRVESWAKEQGITLQPNMPWVRNMLDSLKSRYAEFSQRPRPTMPSMPPMPQMPPFPEARALTGMQLAPRQPTPKILPDMRQPSYAQTGFPLENAGQEPWKLSPQRY